MIPFKQQLMMSLISLVGLGFLVNRIVKYKLELKYSLPWLFLSLSTIILAVIPRLSFHLADWIGIKTPVNVLFLCGILVSLLIVFSLTIALSQHMVRIRHLSQELGLYKYDLEKLEARVKLLAKDKQ
jgi:hypothetical protein